MPPIREHNVIPDNDDDDAHDHSQTQSPAHSQYNTYTFLADMTPFTGDHPQPQPSSSQSQPHASSSSQHHHQDASTPYSPSQSSASPTTDDFPHPHPTLSPTRSNRTRAPKKRDASYIPRPPNAFILYRSSFIRSNQVPGKVEGNHSTLSKIIGKLWKALPREERDEWEAKALEAQEDHRKKYPHWRFRPGAVSNPIIANPKPKAKKPRRKTKPAEEVDELEEEEEEDAKGKGKGKAKAKAGKGKEKRETGLDDARCAKIAELVREGIKEDEWEGVLEEWEAQWKKEHEVKEEKSKGRAVAAAAGKKATSSTASSSKKRKPTSSSSSSLEDLDMKTRTSSSETIRPPSRTPTSRKSRSPERRDPNSRSGATRSPVLNPTSLSIPLTQQYKRSLSAPAPSRSPTTSPVSASASQQNKLMYEASSAASSPALATLHPHPHPRHHSHPQRIHEHVRRDTVSIPMSHHTQTQTQNYSSPSMEHWHKGQRSLQVDQQQQQWWSADPHPHSPASPLYPPREHTVITTDGMGYEAGTGTSRYEESFIHDTYRPPASVSNDLVSWGNTPGREGCVTLIADPFMVPGDCKTLPLPPPPPPLLNTTTTFSPLSTSPSDPPPAQQFYPPLSPVTPPTLPSSTYSTLSGWAGDTTPLPMSAGGQIWYGEGAGGGWDFSRRHIDPIPIPSSADEWDAMDAMPPSHHVQSGGQQQQGKYTGFTGGCQRYAGEEEGERRGRGGHVISSGSGSSARGMARTGIGMEMGSSAPVIPRR